MFFLPIGRTSFNVAKLDRPEPANTDVHNEVTAFRTPEAVIDFFRQQIIANGSSTLAGIEEEVIVLDPKGQPIGQTQFQALLKDLILALPNGVVCQGRTLSGEILPVAKGTFQFGSVEMETNTTLIEYAHSPSDTAWTTYQQSQLFSQTLARVAGHHGLKVIGAGAAPTGSWDDFKKSAIPHADFEYSWQHMQNDTRPEYCRTVFGTASTHQSMGFSDPELMTRYGGAILRCQPTMMALIGNAPLWNGQRSHNKLDQDLLSYRGHVQLDYATIFGIDGAEYLYPDFLLDPDTNFEIVVRGYLNMPLDRTVIDGRKDYCGKLSMAEYLENGIRCGDKIVFPDAAALTMMLREPIADVRFAMTGAAPRVEARGHDSVCQPVAVALDACYRGILSNLDEVRKLMNGLEIAEVRNQRRRVCVDGLAAIVKHDDLSIRTQQDLAIRLLGLAEDGLIERGHNEQQLLSPLFVLAETGVNPAQRMIEVWQRGNDNCQALFQATDYNQQKFADGCVFAWPEHITTAQIDPAKTKLLKALSA